MKKEQLTIRKRGFRITLICYLLLVTCYLFTACDNKWATDILPPREEEGARVTEPFLIYDQGTDSYFVGEVFLLKDTRQDIEYAISTDGAALPGSLLWQDSTIFQGLASGETYFVYARSKKNARYRAGVASRNNIYKYAYQPEYEYETEWVYDYLVEYEYELVPEYEYEMQYEYEYEYEYEYLYQYEYEYEYETDGSGNIIYDENGNPKAKYTDEHGNPVPYPVDVNGDPIYKLDDDGNRVPMTDKDGNPLPKYKDEDGNPVPKETDQYGNPVPKYTDSNGNPVPKYTDPVTGEPIPKKDADGNIIYKPEYEHEYDLDANGNIQYDADGNPVYVLGPDGKPVVKKDADGNPIIKKDENGDPVYQVKTDSNGNPLVKEDANGEPIIKRDENGDPVYKYEYEYETDAAGNPILDNNGNPIVKIDPDTGNPIIKRDENGNPVYEIQKDANGDPVVKRDANGNPIPKTDENGNPVLVLDADGNPILIVDNNGDPILKEVIKKDENGDPIPKLDADGNPIIARDKDGNIIYKTDDDGNRIIIRDPEGNPVYETDADGNPIVNEELKIIYFTIFFNSNGGHVTDPDLHLDSYVVKKDTVITLPDGRATLAKGAGSVFGAWNTRRDGMGRDLISGTPYKVDRDNTILWAKWLDAQTYILPYDQPSGGAQIQSGVTISQSLKTINPATGEPYPLSGTLVVPNVPDENGVVFTNPRWVYGATPLDIYASDDGFTLTVDGRNILYNVLGDHMITLFVDRNGVPSNFSIMFNVVQ